MKAKLQLLIIALGIAALSTPAANAGGQGNPNPGILPPQAVFKGKTMSEWCVAWWQWVQGVQGAPQMFDATGEFAHVNNNGADGVFFLAKTWSGVPQVRHVVIPSGTPLFVPVMGIGWWEFPGDAVGLWGSFENFLAAFPESDMHDLEIIIDGKPVAALEDGNPHYLHYFGADGFGGGEFPVVTAWNGWLIEYFGYEIALLLAPLPPGKHVIEMKGKSACCGGFVSDVTYHLTVEPGKK
jgi:hypothetical protein